MGSITRHRDIESLQTAATSLAASVTTVARSAPGQAAAVSRDSMSRWRVMVIA